MLQALQSGRRSSVGVFLVLSKFGNISNLLTSTVYICKKTNKGLRNLMRSPCWIAIIIRINILWFLRINLKLNKKRGRFNRLIHSAELNLLVKKLDFICRVAKKLESYKPWNSQYIMTRSLFLRFRSFKIKIKKSRLLLYFRGEMRHFSFLRNEKFNSTWIK